MFHEKVHDGHPWSMTRVVAFLFALTQCTSMLLYAWRGHEIAWPFCVLGVVTLLAVPLQALFKYLQVWFTSSPGQRLLRDLLAKVSPSLAAGLVTETTATATTATTKTTAENG